MAKVTIVGEAIVITSELTLDDIQTVGKYRPDALVLMGGEDDKDAVFCIGTTNRNPGSIGRFSAEFGGETHDENKFATITLLNNAGDVDDIREAVAEELGVAILNLNKIEERVPAVLAEIAAEKAAILANITVA